MHTCGVVALHLCGMGSPWGRRGDQIYITEGPLWLPSWEQTIEVQGIEAELGASCNNSGIRWQGFEAERKYWESGLSS